MTALFKISSLCLGLGVVLLVFAILGKIALAVLLIMAGIGGLSIWNYKP